MVSALPLALLLVFSVSAARAACDAKTFAADTANCERIKGDPIGNCSSKLSAIMLACDMEYSALQADAKLAKPEDIPGYLARVQAFKDTVDAIRAEQNSLEVRVDKALAGEVTQDVDDPSVVSRVPDWLARENKGILLNPLPNVKEQTVGEMVDDLTSRLPMLQSGKNMLTGFFNTGANSALNNKKDPKTGGTGTGTTSPHTLAAASIFTGGTRGGGADDESWWDDDDEGTEAQQAALAQVAANNPPLKAVEEHAKVSPTASLSNDLGKHYAKQGRNEDARRLFDVGASKGGQAGAESSALRAGLNLKEGRNEEAAEDASRALERDPGNKRAREILAYLRGREGQMKGASLKPDFGAGRSEGADAGPGPGSSSPIGAQAGAAMTTGGNPASPARPLVESAWRKLAMGDMSGAVLDVTRGIAADPKDSKALILRSLISNRLGNYDAAIKDADAALRLEPGNVAARLEKAYAFIETGRVAEALIVVEGVLAGDASNALAHLYRGMALLKLGREGEAQAAFSEAVRLDSALRVLAEKYLPKAAGKGVPGPKVDKRKALWMLFGLMALLLILEGIKRVLRPNWSTTAPPASRAATDRASGSAGTLPPGATLSGNYRVERELARGGMGVVYEATDLTLKRSVAIKQLRRDVYESPSVRERFLHEARLAAKLRHPNLAQIFSVISENELYLIFEFVEGESLDKVLTRKGRLTVEETAALLKPVCSALDYAHSQKVIHRDLKPANVMLSVDGTLKLMDFGIAHEARTASVETKTEAWGTPPYMAPEQESGVVSRLSDLYSLGVMGYELLTGQRPFPGAGSWGDKLSGRFIPPSTRGLPETMDAVFAKALAPEPAKRFQSAAAFHDALCGKSVTPSF